MDKSAGRSFPIYTGPPANKALSRAVPVALCAAVICVAFLSVDWVGRFPYAFPDLSNYRSGFSSGWYVFSLLNTDWLSFLLTEGVWVYGFDALWNAVGDMELSFLIVTALATFLILLYIISQTQSLAPALFILNPAFIHLVAEQLRSGLAVGIFLMGVKSHSQIIRLALFILSSTIHTSFILFFGLFYLYYFSSRLNLLKWLTDRYLLFFIILLTISILLTYFRETALAAIGDERAFIIEDQTSGILLGIAWFSFIVSYFVLRRKIAFDFNFYFFVINVFMFISSIFVGVYGARFVAVAIPALAVMSRDLDPGRRPFFYAHYALFSFVYFLFWADT